eukprot:2723927-Rhodomonas_salina.1
MTNDTSVLPVQDGIHVLRAVRLGKAGSTFERGLNRRSSPHPIESQHSLSVDLLAKRHCHLAAIEDHFTAEGKEVLLEQTHHLQISSGYQQIINVG